MGPAHYDYFERTIEQRMAETRMQQSFSLDFSQRQPWGDASIRAEYEHFLHDFGKYRADMFGNLRFRITRGLSLNLRGNLAWVDARLDEFKESVGGTVVSRAGNRPANTPARVGNLWLEWRPLQDWTLGAELRAVSSRQADTANTLRVPGYATLGAHVAWQAGPRTAVVLRGRNLGDRRYTAHAVGEHMAWLGDPRSWELVVRQAFD